MTAAPRGSECDRLVTGLKLIYQHSRGVWQVAGLERSQG
jgi:hypothetical protein